MSNRFLEQLQGLTARFTLAEKLFKSSSASIGLDLGSSFLKGVRLSKEPKGFKLEEAVCLPVGPKGDGKTQALQELAAELKLQGAKLSTAVSGAQSVLRTATFPKMTKEELGAALAFEAEKHIPFKLEEVFFDFQILEEKPGNRMEVLLAAARRDLVDSHLAVLQGADLIPDVVDLEASALANAWEVSPAGQDQEVAGLVHLGARGTLVNFFLGKRLQFSREIPFGTNFFSEAPAEALQTKWEEWLAQCRTSFDFYENQFGQGVKRLVLSGGASRSAGFLKWLPEASGLPVEPWNPASGLTCALEAKKLEEWGSGLGVAIGLAIRGFAGA
ncbi:MAG: pilus assembly protein PilM [Candidatus Omnitrophica bacterium]|nr:pilus assembly protein PilM [Candidatus Omnitrophota bacterium]